MERIALLPFPLLLLTIAIFPLANHKLWEKNSTKAIVAGIFGIPAAIYVATTDFHSFLHTSKEYISFISLIVSLFIVSGGIYIDLKVKPSPIVNSLILLLGAVISNFIGTTGASMVLIRLFLRLNRWRNYTFHIPVFFIFLVSNIGGLLTPFGDPPLYMGFLKGVPFFWTLKNLIPEWTLQVMMTLSVFFVWDWFSFRREKISENFNNIKKFQGINIEGKINFVYVLCILLSAILLHFPFRELVMWTTAILSLKTTSKDIRKKNEFTFHPAEEVSILFAGIFATMVPVLDFVKINSDKIGISEPWHFFFITGVLSTFLDNAPTYLTFFSLAAGLTEKLNLYPTVAGVYELYLKSISVGAVFFGANSYIGNAPNFMVKSISEEMKVKAPNFLMYILWAAVILFPQFILIASVFFGLQIF